MPHRLFSFPTRVSFLKCIKFNIILLSTTNSIAFPTYVRITDDYKEKRNGIESERWLW